MSLAARLGRWLVLAAAAVPTLVQPGAPRLATPGTVASKDTPASAAFPTARTEAWQPIGPLGDSCQQATGRRLHVGPQHALQRPSQAAAAARDGDVVLIDAGTWRGDVATWPQHRLTICAVGGPVHLHADGQHAGGKGIWVLRGRDVLVDGIQFHGATVPDQNGAGIRAEGDGLTLRHVGFFDNQNGILGPSNGTLTVQRAVFARNGVADPALQQGHGRTHQLYTGGSHVRVLESLFTDGRVGHHIKSRARRTEVENTVILDGPDGTASYLVEAPDGGELLLRGNQLHKGPRASNAVMVRLGAEQMADGRTHRLVLLHNTWVSDRPATRLVVARLGVQQVLLAGNLWASLHPLLSVVNGEVTEVLAQRDNRTLPRSHLPAAADLAKAGFWPVAAAAADTALPALADPAYLWDAPRPRESRRIAPLPGPRHAGALQAPP